MKARSSGLKSFHRRLFRFSDEAMLNRPARVILILMDLFILMVLFQGLEDHTRQLTTPEEYLPSQVRNYVLQEPWDREDRLDGLQRLALMDVHGISYAHEVRERVAALKARHPVVERFLAQLDAIQENAELVKRFRERQNLQGQASRIEYRIQALRDDYQTSLLEDIADVRSVDATDPATVEFRRYGEELGELRENLTALETRLLEHEQVLAFFELVESEAFEQRREALVQDFRKVERWYPVKEFFWQMLFLAPLMVLFYAWNARAVRRDQHMQVLITSHLMVVLTIPILLQAVQFVGTLIPNYVFAELFALLKALHLIALWHYFLILFGVALALFAIWLFQKKLLSQQRLQHKRVLQGNCFHCGKRMPGDSEACPSCGSARLESCEQCGKPCLRGVPHCNHCGAPTDPTLSA